jgi:hypothetical protein
VSQALFSSEIEAKCKEIAFFTSGNDAVARVWGAPLGLERLKKHGLELFLTVYNAFGPFSGSAGKPPRENPKMTPGSPKMSPQRPKRPRMSPKRPKRSPKRPKMSPKKRNMTKAAQEAKVSPKRPQTAPRRPRKLFGPSGAYFGISCGLLPLIVSLLLLFAVVVVLAGCWLLVLVVGVVVVLVGCWLLLPRCWLFLVVVVVVLRSCYHETAKRKTTPPADWSTSLWGAGGRRA